MELRALGPAVGAPSPALEFPPLGAVRHEAPLNAKVHLRLGVWIQGTNASLDEDVIQCAHL